MTRSQRQTGRTGDTLPPIRRGALLGLCALLALGVPAGEAPAGVASQRPGFIQVICEPGVTVLLDGIPNGVSTPELDGWIIQNVPPGAHVVRALKEGFLPQETRLVVLPGRVQLFRVPPFQKLAAPEGEKGGVNGAAIGHRLATLIIRSVPVDCRVRIEGLALDTAKSTTEWRDDSITPGTYEVEAMALGKTLTQAITVEGGATVEMLFNFLKANVEVVAEQPAEAGAGGTAASVALPEQIAAAATALAAAEKKLTQVRLTLQNAGANMTLEMARELVDQRDELDRRQRDLSFELKVLRQRLTLEKERAQEEAARRRRREFEQAYEQFRVLEKDPDLSPALVTAAWQSLCRNWRVDPGSSVGRLLWDERTSSPYKVESRMVPLGPGTGLELVLVRAGSFLMGADDGDDDEKPMHDVTISEAFWMGKHEVTQSQYQAITDTNPSRFSAPDRPVESVSWQDAQAFCEALTERERNAKRLPAGFAFRLPTEAEWEYACRAGSTTAYAFGEQLQSGMANVGSGQGRGGTSIARETLPVGSFKGNHWDLFDMHGNVWEWCLDWYDREFYGRSPVIDPYNRIPSAARVCRGGSWIHPASFARSANRNYGDARLANYMTGFRVVLARVPGLALTNP
ncbi:MAG: SUMF1/EgtB/PvdO family nonheme iron enzyme [Lentisphaeria bacterium]|nr:SUMF1/EgtB/PvdO family nonheme iron enzyme [Lentisphaeria bacterium]